MTEPDAQSPTGNPQCWVCQKPATHKDTSPPHEYTCDDHALSIDAERFRDADDAKPDYAVRAQKILEESLDRWHDDDWDDKDKHTAAQRAMFTIEHEVDDDP